MKKFAFIGLLLLGIIIYGYYSLFPQIEVGESIVASSFEVVGSYINVGLAYDTKNDVLWIGECNLSGDGYIHKTKKDGTELAKYQITGTGNLQGVAYDSLDDTIWVTNNQSGNNIIHVDKQGNVLGGFRINSNIGAGIAYNWNDDTLFISPIVPDRTIYETDKTGNILNTITIDNAFNPSSGLLYADGIAYDADGTLWITQNGNPSIWHIDQSGNVLLSLANPSGNEAEGIAIDQYNTLWYSADEEYHQSVANGNRIFNLDKAGDLIHDIAHAKVGDVRLAIPIYDNVDTVLKAETENGIKCFKLIDTLPAGVVLRVKTAQGIKTVSKCG